MSIDNVVMGSPNVAMGSPNVAMGSPNVVMGSPNVVMGSPNVAMGSPNVAMGSPNVAMGSPNVAMGSPNVAMGSPNVVILSFQHCLQWIFRAYINKYRYIMSRNYFYSSSDRNREKDSGANAYGMFKGRLAFVAPFVEGSYVGSPHYVLRLKFDDGSGAGESVFNVAINSSSVVPNAEGSEKVLMNIHKGFKHPLLSEIESLSEGLYRDNFPKLDYLRLDGLIQLSDLRPIPAVSEDGSKYDVNDEYNSILGIDVTQGGTTQDYFNGSTHSERIFYPNLDDNLIVFAFGFIYRTHDGLHETHMNQGNVIGEFDSGNGVWQDGAVLIYRSGVYTALFTAFETQRVPTDNRGYPTDDSKPLLG
ncbi:hypothetical protein CHS0354_000741 [Potamilus streckersoni]|uniref:Uncharacterized protein n=1 Tax=Potamilus streckersoni TaxID=2493646 RepID=A0AAE0T746_9BIVA|nr:hypothetical protein CHS0354_000741 [Potamilus streckersoni]